jgi:hypothetical protein
VLPTSLLAGECIPEDECAIVDPSRGGALCPFSGAAIQLVNDNKLRWPGEPFSDSDFYGDGGSDHDRLLFGSRTATI